MTKPWLPPLRESFLIPPDVGRALDTLIRAVARVPGDDAAAAQMGEPSMDDKQQVAESSLECTTSPNGYQEGLRPIAGLRRDPP